MGGVVLNLELFELVNINFQVLLMELYLDLKADRSAAGATPLAFPDFKSRRGCKC